MRFSVTTFTAPTPDADGNMEDCQEIEAISAEDAAIDMIQKRKAALVKRRDRNPKADMDVLVALSVRPFEVKGDVV